MTKSIQKQNLPAFLFLILFFYGIKATSMAIIDNSSPFSVNLMENQIPTVITINQSISTKLTQTNFLA
jgi:hypothetical protein